MKRVFLILGLISSSCILKCDMIAVPKGTDCKSKYGNYFPIYCEYSDCLGSQHGCAISSEICDLYQKRGCHLQGVN